MTAAGPLKSRVIFKSGEVSFSFPLSAGYTDRHRSHQALDRMLALIVISVQKPPLRSLSEQAICVPIGVPTHSESRVNSRQLQIEP